MRLHSVVILVLLAISFFGGDNANGQPPNRPRRVLLLGQKPDGHPAASHEYMAGIRILAHLLNRQPGVQTVVIQADSPWNDGPELLDGADGTVLYLSEGAKWLSDAPERLAAFQRLAKRGGGLTCLHWAMGSRNAEPVAQFTTLFGACHGGPDRKYKVVSVTVKPASSKHEILAGINPFEVHDEFYYSLKMPLPARNQTVLPLLLAPIDATDEMVAWACTRPDSGRSFGFSGLHFHKNWELPEYRRLVLQGVMWSVSLPIPPEGFAVEVPAKLFNLPEATTMK